MKIDKLIRPGEFVNLRQRFGVGQALYRAFVLVVSIALAVAVSVKYTGWIEWDQGLIYFALLMLFAIVKSWSWFGSEVILTNQRLLEQNGGIGLPITEIELSEIGDFMVSESFFGRPGNLIVQVSGGDVHIIQSATELGALVSALTVAINKPPVEQDPGRLWRVHLLISTLLVLCSMSAPVAVLIGTVELLGSPAAADEPYANLTIALLVLIGIPLYFAIMIAGYVIPGILVLLVIRVMLPVETAGRIICCGVDKFDHGRGRNIRRKITDFSRRFLGYLYGQPIECD
jgi:hypothetical protein